jgi:hypothetical protein
MFASAIAFKIAAIEDRDDYVTMNSIPGAVPDGEGNEAPPGDLE